MKEGLHEVDGRKSYLDMAVLRRVYWKYGSRSRCSPGLVLQLMEDLSITTTRTGEVKELSPSATGPSGAVRLGQGDNQCWGVTRGMN